jgi:hypothetical protein
LLTLVIALFSFDVARGYIIDQHWERPQSPYDWDSLSILNGQPLGQEFTAGADSITAVAVSLTYFGDPPSGIASITAKIRNSTITGSIVTSATLTLEDPLDEWWYFDFGQEVPITAGNRYVVDVSISVGSQYWSWNSWEDSDNIGVPGRMIYYGEYYNPGGPDVPFAFGFRTYTVPEPTTVILLGLGGLALLRKRR